MKEKRFILLYLLIYFPVFINAQNILRSDLNLPRPGDKLVKQQVEYREPGDKGRNRIWDFRFLQPINEEYTVSYFLPDAEDVDLLGGLEHNTRYYYRQKEDSLWAVGYENTTTTMNYTQPELQLYFPLQYGNTFHSNFEGEGEYGRMLPLSIQGEMRLSVDAEGTLLLPDTRVEDVLCIHSVREYTESGKPQTIITVDRWSWYAPNVRYPIFESIQTSQGNSKGEQTIFHTSFYCPPHLQPDNTTEEIQPQEMMSPDDIRSIFTDAKLFPNPVTDYLTVQYKLTRKAQIWFTLHNHQGILKNSVAVQFQNEGNYTQTIDMSFLPTGIYTFYAHVDDQELAFNIIKS
jgi:hypothetical protein